jgi:hypothetical protein
MAVKLIRLWNYDDPESTSDVVLVKSDDEEIYRECVSVGAVIRPERLFLIMPAGYGSEATLAHYVKYKFFSDDQEYVVSVGHRDALHFFSQWEHLRAFVNAYDPASYRTLRSCLTTTSVPLLRSKTEVLNLVDDFAEAVLVPLTECQLFLEGDARDRKKWWQDTPGWLTRTNGYLARLRSLSKDKRQMTERFERIAESTTKAIRKLDQPSLANALYHASAYVFSLAVLRIKQKRELESCLLSHRSIDMYLQYLAMDRGILAEYPEGLRYKYPDINRKMVTLINTEFYLIRDGLARSQKRFEFLLWLNNIRNSLLYTHGFHGALESEARDALQKVAEAVKSVGDTGRWKHMVAEHFSDSILENRNLFDLEDGLETYIREINP